MPSTRGRNRKAEAAEEEASAANEDEEEKSPEQALADKLELDRFIERLRRKFH